MTVRAAALTMTLMAVLAGCSKTEEAKHAPVPVAADPAPVQSAPIAEKTESPPAPAGAAPTETVVPQETEFQRQARLAAEARARVAEIEAQEHTRRELERQQLATQAEAARAAVLAAENAALRARAYENEQRALEAERAAYGTFGNSATMIIVQPPQRPRPRPSLPVPQHEPPPKGAGVNVGLNRPAVPDLTPPGPPATFGAPKFDTMRARKPRSEAPN